MSLALSERYDLVRLDVRPASDGSVIVADLSDACRDTYRRYFKGVDAVIHCAYLPGLEGTRDGQFRTELVNLVMLYNVLQTSVEEDVQRVVVASSNHAADYHEALIWDGLCDFVTPDMHSLSDNLYGWSKIASEKLGFAFACGGPSQRQVENLSPGFEGQVTRPLSNVHIRIGSPSENAVHDCPLGDAKRLHRALGAYLSARDQVQLFVRSVETSDICDRNGVAFQVFNGISGNAHRFWSLADARRVIGYEPADDSQVRFAEQIGRHVAAQPQAINVRPQPR